jgi:hypothetical protein
MDRLGELVEVDRLADVAVGPDSIARSKSFGAKELVRITAGVRRVRSSWRMRRSTSRP